MSNSSQGQLVSEENAATNFATKQLSNEPRMKLSSTQIEQLQTQIRQFKILGKRFADTFPQASEKQPKTALTDNQNDHFRIANENAVKAIDSTSNSMHTYQLSNFAESSALNNTSNNVFSENPMSNKNIGVTNEKGINNVVDKPNMNINTLGDIKPNINLSNLVKSSTTSNISTPTTHPSAVSSLALGALPTAATTTATAAPMSWQCFHSLLCIGPSGGAQLGGGINSSSNSNLPGLSSSASSTGMAMAMGGAGVGIGSGNAVKGSADAIGVIPGDIGSFTKSASLPLVLSIPYASTLREKLLKQLSDEHGIINKNNDVKKEENETAMDVDVEDNSNSTSGSAPDAVDWELFALQRRCRAEVIQQYLSTPSQDPSSSSSSSSTLLHSHPLSLTGQNGVYAGLLSRKAHCRPRRTAKRDVRHWEKEERRKKQEMEDRRRRRYGEYLKAVVAHREDFVRFHKFKRSECAKSAKSVKTWQDLADSRKERDEARLEMKRMQALKENDMEAYSKLLQETKNDRLHYLISQTDTYMSAINEIVQNQRAECGESEDSGETAVGESGGKSSKSATENRVNNNADKNAAVVKSEATTAASPGATSSSLMESSKVYYDNTHRKIEAVSQPRMLQGGDLKEYQLSGLLWMVSLYNNNLNGILADEMGLGKTIQTIALLAYLMEYKNNKGPFMIVVPLSTLSNWVNEVSKWAPDMIKVVYRGSPQVRKQLYKDEIEHGHFNLLLTTYEFIMKDKGLLRKHTWQYIIVDEGHRMKNAQSKFAQTLGTVYQSKHRLLLTGTPLQNNLPELWALLNFLLPTIFSSVDTFDQWFNKPFATFKNPAANASAASMADESDMTVLTQEERMLIVHRLHEVLRPFMLRRVKDQVLDQLPEKSEKVIRCELSGWQRRLYNIIHERSLPALKGTGSSLDLAGMGNGGGGGGGGGLNNAIMQLRKVCNHPYLFLSEWYMDNDLIRSSGKFELLDRMLPKLKAAGHRVLMFSQMTQVMTILERFFEMKGFSHLRLDGATSSEEREKRMYQFNDPDSPYFIFLLSTRAGGLGLNLATADTVILFDSDWNPMMDAQAQDRAHRIGQKNEVRVFRLITTTPVEEKILARATEKLNLTGLVVEAGKFHRGGAGSGAVSGKGGMDKEREEMMETLLKELSHGGGSGGGGGGTGSSGGGGLGGDEGAGETEEEEVEIPDDDLINEMMAVTEDERLLYQEMDRKRKLQQANSKLSTLMAGNEEPTWLLPSHWGTKQAQLQEMMSKKSNGKGSLSAQYFASSLDGEEEAIDEEDPVTVIGGKVMRQRKSVVYDDGLTEQQFLRRVEKNADIQEQEDSTKKFNKQNRTNVVPSGAPMTEDQAAAVVKVIQSVQKIKKSDGSVLSFLFKVKPDKSIYPDYYQIVPQPISLKEITARAKKKCSLSDIENDFKLMSHNARLFNTELSPVFLDAEELRREFYRLCSESPALEDYLSSTPPPLPDADDS